MASFNQSPLGQSPLPFISISIAVTGSGTNSAGIKFDQAKYRVASLAAGDLLELKVQPAIFPDWRRESRKTG